jgi:hypothetical protein
MKLKVIAYNELSNYHECRDEQGNFHRVDLFVDGTLPEGITREFIIGRAVEVEFLSAFEEIGHGVKILPQEET